MSNTIGMEVFVEVDENERYWIGNGFGKGGLLIGDRGAFSTTDGSLSWKSSKEASEDPLLLGRGWSFSQDQQCFAPTRKDQEGWMYATDFRPNHMADARPCRGNLHWVRFRRLIRTKIFDPEGFVGQEIYEKCNHCDSKETDALSKLLLETIAYISMLTCKSQVTDAVLFPLKATVIDMAIDHELSDMQEREPSQELNVLRKTLMSYIEKERSRHAMSRLLSGSTFLFAEREKHPEFHERCATVAARCLPKNERDAIAGLIVRKLDPNYRLHCDRINCGTDCIFMRSPCPHAGCPEIMSKNHLDAHADVCKFKIITCECGEAIKAGEMSSHLGESCRFRLVDCPFKSIGCTKRIRACELEQHITEDMAAHLLLAVGQINTHKDELIGLRGSLEVLQAENQALAHVINQQKDNFSVKISNLDAQVTKVDKELGDFESSYHKEIRILKSPKRSLA